MNGAQTTAGRRIGSPAPVELQKPKRGRAKRVAAGILCGVLLVGGSVGAGWLLKDRLDGRGLEDWMKRSYCLLQI